MSESLRVEQLAISYRRRSVLTDLDLCIGPGVTALVGENGSGKSSVLRVVAGLVRPVSGRICWEGGTRIEPARDVGYLPQSPQATRLLSARAYVEYFAMLRGVPRSEVVARSGDALDAVGLIDRRNDRTTSLSGGMFRRLAIAATIVASPRVLLLDEPTVGLDLIQREAMLELIDGLSRDRITLFSTHLVEDLAIPDVQLAVLEGGHLSFHGTKEELPAGGTGDIAMRLQAALLGQASAGLEHAG